MYIGDTNYGRRNFEEGESVWTGLCVKRFWWSSRWKWGGGLALTGGAYVGPEGGITSTNRWLRFDFNDPNHRSLVILGGTSFTIGENIVTIDETTSYNLSDYISEEGADYYVFINADGRVVASTLRTQPDGYMFIGQFHTLCEGVPANTTAIFPVTTGRTVGEKVRLISYDKNSDLDFANFYIKNIDAINDRSPYAVATVLHTLQGFNTCDILPESVWCLNFHPKCKNWDGMVYCKESDIAVDIYDQCGTEENCTSEYGSVVTKGRQYQNCQFDMNCVGKKIISYYDVFNMSIGSNQKTCASSASSISGGHVDTVGRRMISFIGCEDCIGFMLQKCRESAIPELTQTLKYYDGLGYFGGGDPVMVYYTCGGGVIGAPNVYYEGSRYIDSHEWNAVPSDETSRGSCDISIV